MAFHQRKAETDLAVIELHRTEDRGGAEVTQAYAESQLAAERVALAQDGVHLSLDSAEKNLSGLGQTKRAGDIVLLVQNAPSLVENVRTSECPDRPLQFRFGEDSVIFW